MTVDERSVRAFRSFDIRHSVVIRHATPVIFAMSCLVPTGVAAATEIVTHAITSEYQPGELEIRILAPAKFEPNRKYPVVYLLPVEAGRESRYGDSISVAREMNAAERFGAILVAPTFAQLPWYADHPTDPAVRHESHFVRAVVPFVERTYPVLAEPRGRLLCGFSKSGWGAWSLLLRHPDRFGRASSWDAPLTMDVPGKYGSGPIFGTPENFEKYRLTRLLEAAELAPLDGRPRLVLHGYGSFMDHRPVHEQLERRKIAHAYRDGPKTAHVWSKEWLEPALEALLKP